ncbi:hypothetical protein ANO11243_017130 [Dothideomycetidae sp. 11243]|nr:hypothetical protein ANO11243_017130 [fungal sp. No.11243]
MRGISVLPPEIWVLVFKQFADLAHNDSEALKAVSDWKGHYQDDGVFFNRNDLVNLALTCWSFNKIVTPLLYHSFAHGWKLKPDGRNAASLFPNSLQLLVTLLKKPELMHYIKRIYWHEDQPTFPDEFEPRSPPAATLELLWDGEGRRKVRTIIEARQIQPGPKELLERILETDALAEFESDIPHNSPIFQLEAILGLLPDVNLLACYDPVRMHSEMEGVMDETSFSDHTLCGVRSLSLSASTLRFLEDGVKVLFAKTTINFLRMFGGLERLRLVFDRCWLTHAMGNVDSYPSNSMNESLQELHLDTACPFVVDPLIEHCIRLRKISIRMNRVHDVAASDGAVEAVSDESGDDEPDDRTFQICRYKWHTIIDALSRNVNLHGSLEELALDAPRYGDGVVRLQSWAKAILQLRNFRSLRSLTLHEGVLWDTVRGGQVVQQAHPFADFLPRSLERLHITSFGTVAGKLLDDFLQNLDAFPTLRFVEITRYSDIPDEDEIIKRIVVLRASFADRGIDLVEHVHSVG